MSVMTQEIAWREPKLAAHERVAADEDAFAALVRRQSQFVFRVAYAVVRNVHDAEDVAQEVFLRNPLPLHLSK